MTATKRLSECPDHKPGWVLFVGGKPVPLRLDWEVRGRHGAVHTAVVLHPDGTPNFDRPAYVENPNVNIVAWGRDKDGAVRVAVIRQPRPHADDPEQPGVDGHKPVVFGQLPMGFMKKILGESSEDAAKREAGEEAGATTVISITRPKYPWHNPNPTFVRTWSDLYFLQVDLERIESLRSTRDEPIYSAEYITVPELLRRIREGKDEEGAVYRMCTANSLWMIFFATHPEVFSAD